MSIKIKSDACCAVIQTNQNYSFEITVFDETERTIPELEVEISLSEHIGTVICPDKIKTNNNGIAPIWIQAGSKIEKILIIAKALNAEWCGRLYISNVDIEYSQNLKLREIDEFLLKLLYWDKPKLRVLREFGGGLSGSRVLQAQVVSERGLFLTQIVKIGPKEEMQGEKKKYETFFMNRLPNAAPISDYAESGLFAAIIYGDANAAQCLEPVKPFASYFTESEPYHLSIALSAIFKRGLRAIYRYHTIRNMTFRSLLGKFLPENLVVSLCGGTQPYGIFPCGDKTTAPTTLSPHEVEQLNFKLSKGEIILLQNFPISKMQDGDLNLEDTQKERYKVKVRYDGAANPNFTTGEHVDVVAEYISDRNRRLEFALAHCLRKHGFQENNYGFGFDSNNYPNPLPLLKIVLEKPIDVAWGTIHGDLHWDNVMIESPSNWWLIDYGLTGDGPILFDFIKMELYLRVAVLSKIDEFTPAMLLEFEQELVENPFGYLADNKTQNLQLDKALKTIQNIRRLARPYLIDDFYEYLNLLFVYSLAFLKYYPTADVWAAAEGDLSKVQKLNKNSHQKFFSLAVALNVGRILHWEQLSQKKPSLKIEFVPLGQRLEPKSDKIVLDVGNKCEPGIIDHHSKEEIEGINPESDHSTTSLVWLKPELITDHLANTNPDDVTWVVHEHPDFDCIASAYLAWHIKRMGYFPPGAKQLQKYAIRVDAGADFLETVPFPERTPYALFDFHLAESKSYNHLYENYKKRVLNGFLLMNYFCRLEVNGIHTFSNNVIPQDHEYWNAIVDMGQDQDIFRNFDEKIAPKFQVNILVAGQKKQINGIILESPRSRFFKAWARKTGYPLMVVRWPQPDKPDHRIVISVPPSMKFGLMGLGAGLEKAESQKRKKIKKMRPPEPRRWPDVDNSDPWYDGRSPVHAYTIVDAPHDGTVLDVTEVVEILKRGKWVK